MSSSTDDTGVETASSEHFALLRRLADDLAHELKNPLNSVVINLEVLRTRVRAGRAEAALERIDVIESEVRRLHDLLDQTLRLIRPDRMGVDTFAVDDVLAEAAGLAGVLAKITNRSFVLEPVGEEVRVRAGREALRLAVLTLAEGALRSVPEEGGAVRVHGAVAGDVVLVEVEGPPEAAAGLRAAVVRLRRTVPDWDVPMEAAADGCRMTLTLPRGA